MQRNCSRSLSGAFSSCRRIVRGAVFVSVQAYAILYLVCVSGGQLSCVTNVGTDLMCTVARMVSEQFDEDTGVVFLDGSVKHDRIFSFVCKPIS